MLKFFICLHALQMQAFYNIETALLFYKNNNDNNKATVNRIIKRRGGGIITCSLSSAIVQSLVGWLIGPALLAQTFFASKTKFH